MNLLVKSKLEELFWEWLCLPASQQIVQQTIGHLQEGSVDGSLSPPSVLCGSHSQGPLSPGSPLSRSHREISDSSSVAEWLAQTPTSPAGFPSPPSRFSLEVEALLGQKTPSPVKEKARERLSSSMLRSGSLAIPRFWWPKREVPDEVLPTETRVRIRSLLTNSRLSAISTYEQLEPLVIGVFGLSRYFALPILHKLKVFHNLVDESAPTEASLAEPSAVPFTEQMLVNWCVGRIQPDDPVLTFFSVVKKEHHNWIEREDFNLFLTAILLTHPGLEFLRGTPDFQDRYAETVISRIFYVYDKMDVGRIYLSDLRRYKPSLVETWKLLAESDDIKVVRDFFSYEHFYVMYCTFWELDTDHDWLLDKDDLIKYDGHALSRRTVDRIFSEIPSKFTSAVPGKMGYDDFIRFLLCDQDRQSDRSVEYWFHLLDLDGDGCIRDYEMKYFYEEQLNRMECLSYDLIPFMDIMCQMNDMIYPKVEGLFRLSDFKRKRRFAGTFFAVFSSLNKFLMFEQHESFLAKQDHFETHGISEWDRWCANEYTRLAMEDDDEADPDPEEDSIRGSCNASLMVDELMVGRRRAGGDTSL